MEMIKYIDIVIRYWLLAISSFNKTTANSQQLIATSL